MQNKNAKNAISDHEFAKLILLARKGDSSSMSQIIDLYRDEIREITKYIKMCKEDAFQSIVTDFIELLINDKSEIEIT